MKETTIKLDECGAEIRMDEDGVHIIAKGINFNSSHSNKDGISINNTNISSDGNGNIHINPKGNEQVLSLKSNG